MSAIAFLAGFKRVGLLLLVPICLAIIGDVLGNKADKTDRVIGKIAKVSYGILVAAFIIGVPTLIAYLIYK